MNATDKAMLQVVDDYGVEPEAPIFLDDIPEELRLAIIAQQSGDISHLLSDMQLAKIGADCLSDYEQDESDRAEWRKVVERAFKLAAQESLPEKTFPWKGAANVNYPLLTTASLQFAARAYPAVVKGDEVVSVKVVGRDKGVPQQPPQMQQMPPEMAAMMGGQMPPEMMAQMGVQPPMMPQQPQGPQPGAKSARADRVKDYLNTVIFYRMRGWEEDTDTLLHQLPIAGCAFRKVWAEGAKQNAQLVPALKLCVPMTAKDCYSAPRMTEIKEDQALNDIIGMQRSGFYRDVKLVKDENDAEPRKLLEQHCRIDLDDDGYSEPYVVTLDYESSQVLRIEPDFGPEHVRVNQQGQVSGIERNHYYVKYDFFPSLDGSFYGIGLGHLLDEIGGVVNKAINQMIDAGAAQVAGGGFIGSGVNLQGAGKRGGNLYFSPGEYKTVSTNGNDLRTGIYERTFPGPSQIMFSVLEMMLGAARDISSVKDVLTGEARNTGQVGTTLALIEQGLQVFTAIYKRIYRSLKAEFAMLFENLGRHGGEEAAQDYLRVLDDPEANFAADFELRDMDIRPVSDPSSVTKMQKMARAQFLMGFISAPGVNPQAIYKRAWEAADVDDIDELLMPPQPQEPNPKDVAAAKKDEATAMLNMERAQSEKQEREVKALENLARTFRAGEELGTRLI